MNKDEAEKCLELSKRNWKEGDLEKALKFARKALALDGESTQAKVWLETILSASSAASSSQKNDSSSAGYHSKSHSDSKNGGNTTENIQREDTKEQVDAVKRIKACSKDYYAVLGVQKTADEAELKKAYRKVDFLFNCPIRTLCDSWLYSFIQIRIARPELQKHSKVEFLKPRFLWQQRDSQPPLRCFAVKL
jgi:DnaJ family protein B protein 12